jgi:hypothetical protein
MHREWILAVSDHSLQRLQRFSSAVYKDISQVVKLANETGKNEGRKEGYLITDCRRRRGWINCHSFVCVWRYRFMQPCLRIALMQPCFRVPFYAAVFTYSHLTRSVWSSSNADLPNAAFSKNLTLALGKGLLWRVIYSLIKKHPFSAIRRSLR